MITEINGYLVLPVRLIHKPHYIYIRKHQTSDEDDKDRVLFFANVPQDTTTEHVKKLCAEIAADGPTAVIESVIRSELPSVESIIYAPDELEYKLPRNCALVKLVDRAACTMLSGQLKKFVARGKEAQWPAAASELTGASRYYKRVSARYPERDALAQLVRAHMEAFAEREQAELQALENMQLVDEDGFQLVIGKNRKTRDGLAVVSASAGGVVKKSKHNKRDKEKKDFYRFQIREQKKQEMNELLRKFKQDQEKIQQLKERKRFRPEL